jgi:hypothetical protein
MLASTYPLADLFGTMLGFFVLIIWFWLLIIVFSDIFHSHDLGGGPNPLGHLRHHSAVSRHLRVRNRPRRENAGTCGEPICTTTKSFGAYIKDTAGAGIDPTEQLFQVGRPQTTGRPH